MFINKEECGGVRKTRGSVSKLSTKVRKQDRMNGNWGQGRWNKLGKGIREELYP